MRTFSKLPVNSSGARDTVISLLFTIVADIGELFHCTVDPATKPLPLILTAVAPAPAVVLSGVRLAITGTGLFTWNVNRCEVPPPGVGFITEIFAVVAVARSLAERDTCNCVLLTKVVGRDESFSSTTEVEINPDPSTVTCEELAPTVRDPGEAELTVGTGFD